MSDNTINNVSGKVNPAHWDQYFTALVNDFVGRNGLGAPEAYKSLGTAAIPWGDTHVRDLFLNGKLFDPDTIGVSASNGVLSGQVRNDSDQIDFLRADGTSPSFTVEASSTPLNLNINDVGVNIATDLTLGSLVTAPTVNNTALVNDTSFAGGSETRYRGEKTSMISLDNVGSEITDRVGQYVALQHGASEIIFGYIDDVDVPLQTATLKYCYRGYFFDSAGLPIVREAMSDNDTLTLYNLAWAFLQVDGTTLDVTYRTPIWSAKEPASPLVDDYWYDTANQEWKRYNSSIFEVIERTLIGMVVLDGSNCIASRSIDPSKSYSDFISLEVDQTLKSGAKIQSEYSYSKLIVNGEEIFFDQAPVVWDMITDLEAGLVEENDKVYYLYITEKGETIISDERPYDRKHDLKGHYHPYHSWRYVGVCYNDPSGDFSVVVSNNNGRGGIQEFLTSGVHKFLNPNLDSLSVRVWVVGGGGGTAYINSAQNNGGTTSFGTFLSAYGGKAAGSGYGTNNGNGGNGGVGGTIEIVGTAGTGSGGYCPWFDALYGRGSNRGGAGYGGTGGGGGGNQGSYVINEDVNITVGNAGGHLAGVGYCRVEY